MIAGLGMGAVPSLPWTHVGMPCTSTQMRQDHGQVVANDPAAHVSLPRFAVAMANCEHIPTIAIWGERNASFLLIEQPTIGLGTLLQLVSNCNIPVGIIFENESGLDLVVYDVADCIHAGSPAAHAVGTNLFPRHARWQRLVDHLLPSYPLH